MDKLGDSVASMDQVSTGRDVSPDRVRYPSFETVQKCNGTKALGEIGWGSDKPLFTQKPEVTGIKDHVHVNIFDKNRN